MAKTVADQFPDVLVAAGLKRIYGITSDSLNGLTDALRRRGKIQWMSGTRKPRRSNRRATTDG